MRAVENWLLCIASVPNIPAKLFGLSKSPSKANAETTVPPISTLIRISFMLNRRKLRFENQGE